MSKFVIKGEISNFLSQDILGEDLRSLSMSDKLAIIGAMFGEDDLGGKLDAALSILDVPIERDNYGQILIYTGLKWESKDGLNDNIVPFSESDSEEESDNSVPSDDDIEPPDPNELEEELESENYDHEIPPTLRAPESVLARLNKSSVEDVIVVNVTNVKQPVIEG